MAKNPHKRIVRQVANNEEKRVGYAQQKARYKLAMHEGFYLEALLITYAMIEDRLRGILYHSAAIANETDSRVTNKTRAQVIIIKECYYPDNQHRLRINTITGKIQIVEAMLRWSVERPSDESLDHYQIALRAQITERLDVGSALATFGELAEWLNYRNEVIHGLMNKNFAALDKSLEQHCKQGMRLAMDLDNCAGRLKYRNRIRKSVGLK